MRNPRLELQDAVFEIEDTISTTEALDMINESGKFHVTRPTLIAWARKYHIGVQPVPNGDWRIFPDKLALLLAGNLKGGSKY